MSDVRNKTNDDDLKDLSDETIESIGFLTFRGDESLFALDGQHRLAGIKKAIKDGIDQDPYDDLSIIFVAHQTTQKGLERTRRLFTTLNKTAKPVSKGDIVALDEDDAMAICVRWLIEKTKLFSGKKIAFVASNNIPVTNMTRLTTIVSLYDILTILFTKMAFDHRRSKADLQRARPSDEDLDAYFDYAKKYFVLQFNYEKYMELSMQLSRWVYKQLINRFTNASIINSYHIALTKIEAKSALLQMVNTRDKRIQCEKALKELKDLDVIRDWSVENTHMDGRKITDVVYDLLPHPGFIADQKATNARLRDAKAARINS